VGIPEHHPDKFWAKKSPMADLIRSFFAQIWNGVMSYISMQIYEQAFQLSFGAIHQSTAALQLVTFDHLSPDHFLQVLPGCVTLSLDLRYLELEDTGYAVYSQLQGIGPKLLHVVTDLQWKCKAANEKKKGANCGDEMGGDH
jgi:hypothetical protein